MNPAKRPAVVIMMAVVPLLAFAIWLSARSTTFQGGAPALVWAECAPEQVEILILGTYHFAQVSETDDILRPERQQELAELLDVLENFRPDRVAVEHPYVSRDGLDSLYRQTLETPADSLRYRNETVQIGFRLARRLGHETVYPVDVPMNLWHDSIAVYDSVYPGSRSHLRSRWNIRYDRRTGVGEFSGLPLAEVFRYLNTDLPPAESELYGNFLPLVEDDVYAGALKLRPWYDRNLRIVQNLFRALEEDDDRLLLVIGHSHLRVLKQMLDMTPQLCPVDPLEFLPAADARQDT